LEFLEHVTEYVDQGSLVDVLYLEFQKAFDKVPHQRLLKKFQALRKNGMVYTWIEHWSKTELKCYKLVGIALTGLKSLINVKKTYPFNIALRTIKSYVKNSKYQFC
jgi:hypothetical protein